jgi:prenyltransferase beta subunit
MKRFFPVALSVLFCLIAVEAGDSSDKAAIAFLRKLQTPDGAFRPFSDNPPTSTIPLESLRATVAAVRALHYLGSDIPDKAGCIKFVARCHDPESGGFADHPKGKVGVFSTAVGLMGVAMLKMPVDKYKSGAVKFLSEHAKSFEDIRIAAAGLEAIKQPSSRAEAWLEQIGKMRNTDGTYGKDTGQARETGGAAVAVLRLGGKIDRDAVLKAMRAGQRSDGGFGSAESKTKSDLETTYRVMRAFHMLKEQPKDVAGLRSFLSKCRNADGGYGVAPGQRSTAGGTYFAAIIRHWLDKK